MADVSTEELIPLLNPAYWDGHSLGHGETASEQPRDYAGIRIPRPIRRLFEARIATMERIVPIETIHAGEDFDAANYNEGAVVMFREEQLRGDASQLDIDMEAFEGSEIPQRPTEFSLGLGFESSRSEFLRAAGLTYTNKVYCGMVGESRDDGNVVYASSAFSINRFGGGRVITAGAAWFSYRQPMRVGETTHTRTDDKELLQRVNLLEVVAYGETERKKERAKGFLGGLSFRHQDA